MLSIPYFTKCPSMDNLNHIERKKMFRRAYTNVLLILTVIITARILFILNSNIVEDMYTSYGLGNQIPSGFLLSKSVSRSFHSYISCCNSVFITK